MAEGNFRKERKKNVLDNSKLNLSAPSTAQGKRAFLSIQVIANNPRITVRTNDPADQANSYGRIIAAMDAPAFFSMMAMLDVAVNFKPTEAEPEYRALVRNSNYIFPNRVRSEKPVPISDVMVGKDKEGVVWIGVFSKESKDRPKIKFPFALDERFHEMYHGNGTKMTPAEVSVLVANAWLKVFHALVPEIMTAEYVEPPPRNPPPGGGNGGGGNYGGGGGSGGGYSKPAAAADTSITDDDMPW